MSLSQIGSQCNAPYCREIDFLPIKCLHCQHPFCKNHSLPSSHSCKRDPDLAKTTTEFESKLQRCGFAGCTSPSLAYTAESTEETGSGCPGCKASFCATHRHPDTHQCPSPPASEPSTTKNQVARNLISEHFSTPSSSQQPRRTPKRKIPTDPKKLEQYLKIERMKMRHKAIPADPRDKNSALPPDQRLHLCVQIEGTGTETIYWFRRTIGTGKALDQLGSNHGLSANDLHPLYLYNLVGDKWELLKNDQLLEAQAKDGATVLLTHTSH